MVVDSKVIGPILVVFDLIPAQFSLYFAILADYFEFLYLFELLMRKYLAIVIVNWPHLWISKCFLLTLVFNLILYVFSKIRKSMDWPCFLGTHSLCFGRTPFSKAKLNRRFNIFLSYTLTSNLRNFRIALC